MKKQTEKGGEMEGIRSILGSRGEILATHDGADYCYTSATENLSWCSIREVSPEEALSEGWAEVRDGVFYVGPFALGPVEVNYRIIRRRVEDALRKTATPGELLRIATILGVKI